MMKDVFRQIRKQIDRQFRGGQRALKLEALRKLETTHNPEANTYHPHFHCIVHGEENARFLRRRWLELIPGLNPDAQQCKRADLDSAGELFKYFTKLTSGPRGDGFVDVDALDVIFRAVRGEHVFQPYGLRGCVVEVLSQVVEEVEELTEDGLLPPDTHTYSVWSQSQADWVDTRTGEVLSGYVPSDRWATFVRCRIFDGRRRELPDESAVYLPLPPLPAHIKQKEREAAPA